MNHLGSKSHELSSLFTAVSKENQLHLCSWNRRDMEDPLSGRLMVVSYFGNVAIIRMRLESNKRKQYPNVRTSNLEGSDPLLMIHIRPGQDKRSMC